MIIRYRFRSNLPACVGCLYRLGWGVKRIVRHTGFTKTSVHRYAKAHGLTTAETAALKKAREDERRRSRSREWMHAAWRAEWRNVDAIDRLWARHPATLDGMSLTMAKYYKDVNISRAKARAYAKRLYQREREHELATGQVHHRRIARNLRNRINRVVKRDGGTKATHTVVLIGCSIDRLRQHLQSLFEPGMSWANYGEWEIDHIRPCASFNLRDTQQQLACFHYTNLQPLWRADNRKKWATVPTPHRKAPVAA